MFLNLEHKKLDIYKTTKIFVKELYKVVIKLPEHERFGLCSQLRRASTSVFLNISEGASRRSQTERTRYYEMARGSLVEIDTALEICTDVGYVKEADLVTVGPLLLRCFQMLSKMM